MSSVRIMRNSVFLALAFMLCSCGSSRSLGHGYRVIPRTEDMTGVSGAFEKLAHYQELYYRSRRLGTADAFSISPSGNFVVFQDNGRTLLFDRGLGKVRDVTDGTFALAKNFTWNEVAGVVGDRLLQSPIEQDSTPAIDF